MSKDSSIKVFAENASGTRPANAIPVWIDNISAIGGGGGGGGAGGNPEVESYVQTNSATINDVNTSYQTNSANFIPYTASGVELTNSNFKIDTSGQAYKKVTENIEIVSNAPAGGISKGVYFVPGTVFPKGTYKIITSYMGNKYVDLYHNRSRLTGFNIYGNYDDMKSSGSLVLNEQITANTSTYLWCDVERFTNPVSAETVSTQDKEYALKSDVPNIPNSSVDLWNDTATTVQTNSASWAGGASDTFYIYPGKTTDKEISENSGKDLKLYNSANNTFLDFAGKSSYSNYAILDFKNISGTQYNFNTLQHLRLRVYPAATSACKIYQTASVSLLDSNSTISQAQTAYYDSNGNYLSQTHDNLTALNQFVQTNSANWEGGSSPASDTVIFHKATYQPAYGEKGSTDSYIGNASDLYFEARVYSNFSAPNSIIIEHNGSFVGEAYWTQVSSDGEYNYYSASFKGQPNSDYKLNNNGYDSYNWCYVSANGVRTEAFNQGQYKCTTTDTVKINVQGTNITGTIYGQIPGNTITLTSFTGSLTDFTAKGCEQYNCDVFAEVYDYDCSYSLSAEFEAGSTVASSDVFPPTNNLDPYATYYLGWNANNGGLQWFYQGGNGN